MTGSDRDRNEYGRAENQRPRDRTGRPLPYDTDETELAEEFEYDTVEEALETGRWLWGQGRYFEAHECLEDVWHHAADGDADFWQGVIQVAVACVHDQRGNPDGVAATLTKALQRLEGYPDVHHGIDTAALREACRREHRRLEQDREATVRHPALPTVGDGPVFDPRRDETPLTREPPWMQEVAGDAAGEADGG